MVKPLFVIKLGGSVITYKGHPTGKLRVKRIKEIAREIKQAQEEKNFNLILINGVGSYGHPFAKKYGTIHGIKNEVQLKGFCEIKYIVNFLITKLNKIFFDVGLNVFPCQISSLVIQNRGKIFSFNTKPIKQLLQQGIIPMLSGDVVTDKSWGGSICSGDTSALYLVRELKARKVMFASDVDGIFDRDPHKYQNAKLIPEVNKQNFSKIICLIKKSSYIDVTGGMRGKLLEIKKYHKKTKIIIFNGLKKNFILKAFSNRKIGTIIDLA